MVHLFSSRAGIVVIGGGVYCSASWPLGKITLDTTSLTINALFMSYSLSIAQIDRIRGGFLGIRVEHHSPDVPRSVSFWGFRLFHRLREAIERNKINVKIT
jgi:hypothetical protein